ncbi:amidase family protein [Marinomonas epiphytica]
MTSKAWQGRELTSHLTQVESLIETRGDAIFTERFHEPVEDQNKVGELAGAVVTIKDLFDVKGYQTRSGSVFLNCAEPATKDAEAVKRLRQAGAYLLGHTNMTELAYSGLGVNPHYGTPQSPLYPGAIAGGSTSGGAVSVALGMADIALGSDTGGSLRIPAAFCGVTGFKPTQQSVSLQGALPLSNSLDSIGPIANKVSDCEAAWRVLSGETGVAEEATQAHFIVPTNFGFDDMDATVKTAFNDFVNKLKKLPGITVEEKVLSIFDEYKKLPVWQFSAVESSRYYQDGLGVALESLDPRVASRMARAQQVTEQEFAETCEQRAELIKAYKEQVGDAKLLLPTVAILPPKLSSLEQDSDYDRINLLCLRNTSIANVLDACSISLPYQYKGDHIGIMLTGINGSDLSLLGVAKRLEADISQ